MLSSTGVLRGGGAKPAWDPGLPERLRATAADAPLLRRSRGRIRAIALGPLPS